ncbi:MAG: shikimate kinase [Myxococcota bacterium]|nr:shikimate kinase [Myxococcota bacterium]
MSARSPHPKLKYNLALIGGRGCGKSSVGKRLARTNRNFMLFSLDALIRYESQAASIPEIVEDRGWAGFRDLEFEVVEKVSAFSSGALIDCGGGVVVDLDKKGNEIFSKRKVSALKRHSLVVYLERDPDYLLSRIQDDANRPSLSESESFLEIMARRSPWYEQAADLILDCNEQEKSVLAEEILEWFYDRNGIE